MKSASVSQAARSGCCNSAMGLPAAEQAVLRAGGLDVEPRPGPDPLAMTAFKYIAIVKRSLTVNEVVERLQFDGGRVRQLVVDRSLYSFVVAGKLRIPAFQFSPGGGLVPNIARVNRALSPALHPVEVFNWLDGENSDLCLDREGKTAVSPLAWLQAGRDPDLVVLLARRL